MVRTLVSITAAAGLCLTVSTAAAQTANPAPQTLKPVVQAAKPAVQPAPASNRPAEATAAVPALDAMHDVIMPMWHDAYPAKDYTALAGMVPAVERHMAAIAQARLPGILAEKATAWQAGVAALKTAADAYKAAAGGKNNEDLLKAAEALHMQYEKLVRVIKPPMPELDDFHGALYILYHKAMQPFVLAKVTESVAVLKVKMATLDQATLPEKFKARAQTFATERARLGTLLEALSSTLGTRDTARITAAVEALHSQYQTIEKLLE